MFGGQAIFREQDSHPAGSSQPSGELAVAAKRPELVASAVHEEEHASGVRSRGGKPVGWHLASGHLPYHHVVRHWMKATCGGEGGAAIFERRRGLAGTGLLPIAEGVD